MSGLTAGGDEQTRSAGRPGTRVTRPGASPGPVTRWLNTAQPEALFVLSAIAQYIGAAIAVLLFDEVEPQTVAWFRLIGATIALLAVSRGWRKGWTRGQLVAAGVFVAAEFSFVTVDRTKVAQAAAEGDASAAGVQRALRSLSTQLSGAQVGITITNLAIGFLAELITAYQGQDEHSYSIAEQTPRTAILAPRAYAPPGDDRLPAAPDS